MLVFFNVLLEQLGAPIPAVPTLVVAGALTVDGHFSAMTTVALAVLASGIANFTWYLAGRRHGRRVLGLACRITLSPDACVRGTENVFGRWGIATLLVARFVPGVSSVAAPLAGAMRMGAGRFILYDTLGTTAWAALFVGSGVVFHQQANTILALVSDLGGNALAAIVAVLVLYVSLRWIERRRLLRFVRARRIGPAELKAMIESGSAPIIIDVRSTAAREADPRRIPDALEIELADVGTALSHVPRDREIVIFCACPNEASAAKAARVLLRQGYLRVRPLVGGTDGWFEVTGTAS